jgi:sn-glycerol 3-phosphate transport system substrate-binding protein
MRLSTKRRSRQLLATVAVGALALLACSDPPTSGSGESSAGTGDDAESGLPDCPVDALDDAEGPTTVTLWYGGIGGETKQTMEDMVSGFNASQDDVVVTASDQGASYAEVNRKFEAAAAAGTDQLPDVVLLEQTQLQALADGGLVLPAEACMEASGYEITDIEPVIRSVFSVDDVFYPGYANVSSQVLYYNKAHWVKAGLDPEAPPTNMEEVREQAQILKDAGVSDKPFAFKISHTSFTNWLTGEGVDVVDNDNGRSDVATAATFAGAEGVAAVELLQQMDDDGLLNVFSSTEGGIDQYLALATEESSMLIETSGASVNIAAALGGDLTAEEVGASFDESIVDRTSLVPASTGFPGLDSPGQALPGGGGFFLVSASPAPEQAGSWRFLEYMLQPENAKQWHLQGSYLPIVKSVQDDPEVQAFWSDEIAGALLLPAVEALSDADPDEPGPLIGPYSDFIDEVSAALEAALLSGSDAESTLGSAQGAVTESLERYNAG